MAAKKKAVKKTIKKSTKKAEAKYSRVLLVIDRSGSMESVRKEAFEGINLQLQTLKKNANKSITTVSYLQFDSELEWLFKDTPAEDLVDITWDQYVPRSMTALYDATGRGLTYLETNGRNDKNVAFLVIVVSDGQNNVMMEYTQDTIAKKIEELQGKGNWTITYLMANIDVQVVQRGLKVNSGNIAQYNSTSIGTQDAFLRAASATQNWGSARGMSAGGVAYASADFYGAQAATGDTTDDINKITSFTVPTSKVKK